MNSTFSTSLADTHACCEAHKGLKGLNAKVVVIPDEGTLIVYEIGWLLNLYLIII